MEIKIILNSTKIYFMALSLAEAVSPLRLPCTVSRASCRLISTCAVSEMFLAFSKLSLHLSLRVAFG